MLPFLTCIILQPWQYANTMKYQSKQYNQANKGFLLPAVSEVNTDQDLTLPIHALAQKVLVQNFFDLVLVLPIIWIEPPFLCILSDIG